MVKVGVCDGRVDGWPDGSFVGALLLDGVYVGALDAVDVGLLDAVDVGLLDGVRVGLPEGFFVGFLEGVYVGHLVSAATKDALLNMESVVDNVALCSIDAIALSYHIHIYIHTYIKDRRISNSLVRY